jgi:simple sugar transport system substrate-binding protein
MRKVDPKVDEAIETLNMKDGPSRRRLLGGAGLFSATAAASALISACSSSSSSSAATAKSAVGNFPSTPKWQFYFVNHADTNEFFTPTKYGYADAAALLGLPTPIWGGSATSNDAEMIDQINTAISAKAAGIATSVIDPNAFTTPIANAMAAGIPVISYNSDGSYKNGVAEIGSNRLAYVGQALYLSGQAMGNQIKALIPGGGEIAMFIATPGTGNIQPRYDGAKSVLGSNFSLNQQATTTVDATELSDETSFLLGHKSSIKGAFAVDSGSTANLYKALQTTGLAGKIPAGGFDTDPRTLAGIEAGTINFTIFQDPYLQGFLPVLYLYLYNLSGAQLTPPDTDTGLTVLNKGNISEFVKSSRYQGGSAAESYIPRPTGAINQPMGTTST